MSDVIQVYRPTGWGHEITMIAVKPGDIVPGSDYVRAEECASALRQRDERIAALEKALRDMFVSHCLNAAHGENRMCPVCRDAFVLLEAK